MSSKNNPVIQSYATAISSKITPGQMSDLIQKIADDLDQTYTAVFSGPIPADSITAVNASALPTNVAFTNLVNTFVPDQKFNGNFVGGSGKAIYVNDATVGANLRYYWDTTLAAIRCGVGGSVLFQDSTGSQLGKFDSHGLVVGAIVGVTTGPGDILLANNKALYGINAAGSAALKIALVDSNNLVELGPTAVTSGDGHICIPRDTTVNLPAASGARNGIVALDKTTNQICWWVNGARFTVAGVAF